MSEIVEGLRECSSQRCRNVELEDCEECSGIMIDCTGNGMLSTDSERRLGSCWDCCGIREKGKGSMVRNRRLITGYDDNHSLRFLKMNGLFVPPDESASYLIIIFTLHIFPWIFGLYCLALGSSHWLSSIHVQCVQVTLPSNISVFVPVASTSQGRIMFLCDHTLLVIQPTCSLHISLPYSASILTRRFTKEHEGT